MWRKPVDIIDIQRMTNSEIIERIDALVKGDTVKGEMDDDTVLWQLLKIELEQRLSESGTYRQWVKTDRLKKALDDSQFLAAMWEVEAMLNPDFPFCGKSNG